jgi:hypothetical protein
MADQFSTHHVVNLPASFAPRRGGSDKDLDQESTFGAWLDYPVSAGVRRLPALPKMEQDFAR